MMQLKKTLQKKQDTRLIQQKIEGAKVQGRILEDNRPEAFMQQRFQENMRDTPDIAHNANERVSTTPLGEPLQRKENNTGLPDNLKTGIENLSGMSMDDVKVHRNSDKPAQLSAHAYAQGSDIHLGPGQEKHLPHEAWHVAQQKQGRVKPTMQMKGMVNINDDDGLEKEADMMGAKALSNNAISPDHQGASNGKTAFQSYTNDAIAQRTVVNGRTPMDRTELAAHFGIKPRDHESMMIIDALIADSKSYTLHEVAQMLPPRYTPSGAQETALGNEFDGGFAPLGFPSGDDFKLFILKVGQKLPMDATIVFHGSSLTGKSFKDKGGSRLFDVGRESDYDIAITSPFLWAEAIRIGVKIRGNHTEPLTPGQIAQLGLAPAMYEAEYFSGGREVNFMIYESNEEARKHEGPSLITHKAKDYDENRGDLHGDVG